MIIIKAFDIILFLSHNIWNYWNNAAAYQLVLSLCHISTRIRLVFIIFFLFYCTANTVEIELTKEKSTGYESCDMITQFQNVDRISLVLIKCEIQPAFWVGFLTRWNWKIKLESLREMPSTLLPIFASVPNSMQVQKCTVFHQSCFSSVQFSHWVMSTLSNHVDYSTPDLPVHHQILEFTQTHVHWVIDVIQPSHPLSSPFLPPPIFPSIRVFSNESALHIRWPKYLNFSFSISPFNEYSGFISIRMDWLDLLAVQGTLKSLLQHHSSKASILPRSAFFIVHLSHPYMTTRKTIALTRQTIFGKIMSLLFNMLSRLVIDFLPRRKHLLISWLKSPSAVILEPKKIKSVTVSIVSPSICHEVMGPDAVILVF